MSSWIKATDLKNNPILVNMEYAISVHKDMLKQEDKDNSKMVRLTPVTNIMMEKDWGYVVKEDPRLIYDLILEQDTEVTYDPDFENGEEDEGDSA